MKLTALDVDAVRIGSALGWTMPTYTLREKQDFLLRLIGFTSHV